MFTAHSLTVLINNMLFILFCSLSNIKAHIVSYPALTSLYGTTLKYFSVGILFTFNPFIFMIFVYSIRESLYSTFSSLTSGMLSIIISEALLFITYFWGILHFSLSPYPLSSEGIIITSSRMLILTITFILASASCITACLQLFIEKGMSFEISSIIFLLYIIGECFASLQTTEYLHLSYYINDTIYSTLFFCVTGLHFSHVVIGLLLLIIYFIRMVEVYDTNTEWAFSSFGVSYLILPHTDQITILYWHFVEVVWLFIEFLFYSE
nr:cytochrome oxidase subunit 3 [Plasmodium sp. gorilla clade G2]ADN32236.1 cytochrome oxidase subunit 3 [Plasmodium sp. gorilla clade G2]ADN32296.1 cytochrome oxidase subunit 3 [Plasmodium sp. gorilla clade G2]ADN32344.1 cytochrome oxidase subunit 3 [Plasmodium sp. gorilla clade G2]ADN32350.1 cytochrome oxidase subunit 3 [Plasmodium sp. gorilla clade G2]